MKKSIRFALVIALVLSVSTISLSHAQSGAMGGMDMKDMDKGADMKGIQSDKKAQDKVHKGKGTVAKIDSAGGTVTIAHGPIPSMKWPAMTMTYAVKDKALLGKLSPEKKVEFEFVHRGSDYVVTSAK